MLLHLHLDTPHLGGRSHGEGDGHRGHFGHGALATAVVAAAITAAVAGARVLEGGAGDGPALAPIDTELVVERPAAPIDVQRVAPAESVTASAAAVAAVSAPVAPIDLREAAPQTTTAPAVETVSTPVVDAATSHPVTEATSAPAVEQVVVEHTIAVPAGTSVTLVLLLDATGTPVARAVPVDGVARFEGVAAGSYRMLGQAETGVTRVGDSAVSAAFTTPLEPIELPAGGTLVVRLS